MKYALINGVLLDGTEAMQPRPGLTVLLKGDRIEAAVCTQICIKGNEWLSAKVLFGNDFSVFGGL